MAVPPAVRAGERVACAEPHLRRGRRRATAAYPGQQPQGAHPATADRCILELDRQRSYRHTPLLSGHTPSVCRPSSRCPEAQAVHVRTTSSTAVLGRDDAEGPSGPDSQRLTELLDAARLGPPRHRQGRAGPRTSPSRAPRRSMRPAAQTYPNGPQAQPNNPPGAAFGISSRPRRRDTYASEGFWPGVEPAAVTVAAGL